MTPVFRISADAPIERGESDLLGRGGFARSCADAIANWQDDASLVIALWGDWGSGKSSLKNLIVENLGNLEEDPPFGPLAFATLGRANQGCLSNYKLFRAARDY